MGLLIGIDTIAHINSYNSPGKTIAVLGNGFNNIFPKNNQDLFKKILDNEGLVISEYPPNTEHKSQFFIKRNRIISGLSLGVLVIEASFRSGTSITAKSAFLQNKKVFALPHEIWNSHGIGTNKLLKNGAILVTDTKDILQEFPSLNNLISKYKTIDNIKINSFDIVYNESDKKTSSIIDFSNKKILKNNKLSYLYNLISTTPISINELCKKTSKSISEISTDLFSLELDGYIKKVAGGYICTLNN